MSISKSTTTTTIKCDKCGKQEVASNESYNTVFWNSKWNFNRGRKYEHLCYDCSPSKKKKAIDNLQARGF